jgi:hypothetical protein
MRGICLSGISLPDAVRIVLSIRIVYSSDKGEEFLAKKLVICQELNTIIIKERVIARQQASFRIIEHEEPGNYNAL